MNLLITSIGIRQHIIYNNVSKSVISTFSRTINNIDVALCLLKQECKRCEGKWNNAKKSRGIMCTSAVNRWNNNHPFGFDFHQWGHLRTSMMMAGAAVGFFFFYLYLEQVYFCILNTLLNTANDNRSGNWHRWKTECIWPLLEILLVLMQICRPMLPLNTNLFVKWFQSHLFLSGLFHHTLWDECELGQIKRSTGFVKCSYHRSKVQRNEKEMDVSTNDNHGERDWSFQ